MDLTIDLAFDIFSMGADYGQLKMEEERDNEDLFHSFLGYGYSRKNALPLKGLKRREPHSDKWRNAKRRSFENFKKLIGEIGK